jgi:hypothetical protein
MIDQGLNLPWAVIIQIEKRMPVRTIGTLVMVFIFFDFADESKRDWV